MFELSCGGTCEPPFEAPVREHAGEIPALHSHGLRWLWRDHEKD